MATAEVVYLDLEEEYLGIKIDRTKDNNLSEQARKLLKDYYQLKDETSAQQSYARAAVAYSSCLHHLFFPMHHFQAQR